MNLVNYDKTKKQWNRELSTRICSFFDLFCYQHYVLKVSFQKSKNKIKNGLPEFSFGFKKKGIFSLRGITVWFLSTCRDKIFSSAMERKPVLQFFISNWIWPISKANIDYNQKHKKVFLLHLIFIKRRNNKNSSHNKKSWTQKTLLYMPPRQKLFSTVPYMNISSYCTKTTFWRRKLNPCIWFIR